MSLAACCTLRVYRGTMHSTICDVTCTFLYIVVCAIIDMCFRSIFGLDCFCFSLRTPITPAMFSMEELVALGGGSPSDEGVHRPACRSSLSLATQVQRLSHATTSFQRKMPRSQT